MSFAKGLVVGGEVTDHVTMALEHPPSGLQLTE
jgi:hypothetical protein